MKPASWLSAILSVVVLAALAQEPAPAPETPKPVDESPAEVQQAPVATEPQDQPAEQQQKPASPAGPPATTLNLPPPPSDPNEFRVSSDVELVLLDVSVKDGDGGFVSGLKLDDFKVLENKVDQKLTVFQAQDVPVTVGLIVDNSGSVRRRSRKSLPPR